MMNEENVVHNKYLRIIIKVSIDDFFKPERIESLFSADSYTKHRQYNKHKANIEAFKSDPYDTIYTFREYWNIYDTTFSPSSLQITLTSHDSEVYCDFIKKVFEDNSLKDLYGFITGISVIAGESTIARTYKELEDFGLPYLLPELPETAGKRKETIEGTFTDDYTLERELFKCNASCFNMKNALSFRETATVEYNNITGRMASVADILWKISVGKQRAVNLLNNIFDYVESEITDSDGSEGDSEPQL